MEWQLYECLKDEFSAVKKGQRFMISATMAQTLEGDGLSIDTNYVRTHCNPKGDICDFEYVGVYNDERKQPEAIEEPVEAKESDVDKGPDKPTIDVSEVKGAIKGKFFLAPGKPKCDLYDSLEEAQKEAEALDDETVAIVEIVGVREIKSVWT
jgi:hypothetical protein